MKELENELIKRYEKMGKLRADVSVMSRPFTIVVYAFVVVAIISMALSLLFGIPYAIWVAGGSLMAVILMYFIASRIGPVSYSEIVVKSSGKYLILQYISEKHVIFSDGDYTLEYKNKEVKERPEGLLFPELRYNAPLAATYEQEIVKGNKTIYVGEFNDGDKKRVYKVTLSGKFIGGFSMNGRKVTFDSINDREALVGIPAVLADEIIKRGTPISKKDIFLSKK